MAGGGSRYAPRGRWLAMPQARMGLLAIPLVLLLINWATWKVEIVPGNDEIIGEVAEGDVMLPPLEVKEFTVPPGMSLEVEDIPDRTQQPTEESTEEPGATKAEWVDELGSDDIHFVFSTGCTLNQNWESHVLAYSFARIKQRGRLTRIVSGCDEEQQRKLTDNTRVLYPHVNLFFTKDYTFQPYPDMKRQWYPAYNKPFGLRDWIFNTENPVTESIVVFIDPDFIFVRPFVINVGQPVIKRKQPEAHVKPARPYLVYGGKRDVGEIHDAVRDGLPMAQIWTELQEDKTGLGFPDAEKICPECASITQEDAREYYMLGPPYLMTPNDLKRFVVDYCNMTVARREAFPNHWIEEMHGFAFAAAKNQLKHTIVDNLAMIGRYDTYMEFYDYMDENPCSPDPDDLPAVAEQPPLMHITIPSAARDAGGNQWVFYKRDLPEDLFRCDSWLLAQPPPSLWDVAKKDANDRNRHIGLYSAYSVCMGIKYLNAAILDYKRRFCLDGYNTHKKLKLQHRSRPKDHLNIHPESPDWKEGRDRHPAEDLFEKEF